VGESISHSHLTDDARASVSRLRFCPKCEADFCALPASARFCPKCGWDRQHAPDSETQHNDTCSRRGEVAAAQAVPYFELDIEASQTPPPLPPPLAKKAPQRSPLLRGFATALYRLGRRYEGSLGARHHPGEAERCYFKAAKLGNPAAIARIGNTPRRQSDAASPPPADSSVFNVQYPIETSADGTSPRSA
jgi:hypothetical protein